MQIIRLTQEQLAEFMPFLDTLLVPVCSIVSSPGGLPNAQDVTFVKWGAERIDEHLSGRILMLPEVVHTSGTPDSLLGKFLFATIGPYADMGFTHVVFVYSTGTDSQAIDHLLALFTDSALQTAAFKLDSSLQIDSFVVPGIVNLWGKKSANS